MLLYIMKTKILQIALLTLVLTGAAAQGIQQDRQTEEIIVYRLPNPERVYIYNDGSVVYDAAIPNTAIINNTFILPDNVRLDSLSISQGGRRIHSYTTFIGEVLVILRSGERPYQVRVVQVSIPDLRTGVPLNVKYGIRNSGLSWNIMLDMEVQSNNNLNCALIAELRAADNLPEMTRSILARNPEIILASSSNALLEDSAAFFNLGKPLIEANKRQLIRLEEGTVPYRIVYVWDANRRERPTAFLRAQSPLKSMVGQTQFYLNSNGMIIHNGYLTVSPDRPFDIPVGEQPNIVTYKSIVTREFTEAEFPDRKTHPFTHSLEYKVENQSGKAIDLEIHVPITVGINHRTEYTFTTKPPDDRPGDRLLWRYNVPPGGNIVLQFSFDTDVRHDPTYRQFDYSEGNGR